jgi:hypothetical protein
VVLEGLKYIYSTIAVNRIATFVSSKTTKYMYVLLGGVAQWHRSLLMNRRPLVHIPPWSKYASAIGQKIDSICIVFEEVKWPGKKLRKKPHAKMGFDPESSCAASSQITFSSRSKIMRHSDSS